MSEYVKLRAADGHGFSAYVARPQGEPIAGLVVVQEIFGVNPHIRSVADGYAKDGFLAVAPALFDRIRPGIELGYEGADMETAMSLIPKLDAEKAMADIAAAYEYAAKTTGKKVGVVGYCFGGTLAWVAAARLHPGAAVGYYGGRIGNYIRRKAHRARHASLRQAGCAHSRRGSRESSRRASRSRNLLVRCRPRLQLRCTLQLQRRGG